jgi:pantoate--beta-alanine ligase
MGALHEGHLALIRRARRLSDPLVVSLFVNPTQFAPGEDFRRYPRDLAADRRLLTAEGVDILFAPAAADVYPEDFDTYVVPGDLTRRLEGKYRPTHFRGVATIVLKLLNLVQPRLAVFGQKDLKPSLVIEKMTADLNVPVKIVVAPTVREPDGLALSSRNRYLTQEERRRALALSRSLFAAKSKIEAGERSAVKIKQSIRRRLRRADADIDYVSVADRQNLRELKRISGVVAISLACRIGSVRLIDNIVVKVR